MSATSKPITGVIAKAIGDQKADDVHHTNQEHQKERERERKNRVRGIRIQQELDSSRTRASNPREDRFQIGPESVGKLTTYDRQQSSSRCHESEFWNPISTDSTTMQKYSRHSQMQKNNFTAIGTTTFPSHLKLCQATPANFLCDLSKFLSASMWATFRMSEKHDKYMKLAMNCRSPHIQVFIRGGSSTNSILRSRIGTTIMKKDQD